MKTCADFLNTFDNQVYCSMLANGGKEAVMEIRSELWID